MSFYSTVITSLHRVQDGRTSDSGASDYSLQTSADFGNLYWATVSLLSKSSLSDYVTHTREGDKCQFLFKHDSWFSDTDTDMSVSANVKLSLVEGKGVAVVAIFGLSGIHGFTDTIRGYVADGDLANVIASWFKALSYDGKARSYYIAAWDDFSAALSSISEHPGFASAVEDSAEPAEFSSATEALIDMYDELTDRALRRYRSRNLCIHLHRHSYHVRCHYIRAEEEREEAACFQEIDMSDRRKSRTVTLLPG